MAKGRIAFVKKIHIVYNHRVQLFWGENNGR
jgi:hypothetical protein